MQAIAIDQRFIINQEVVYTQVDNEMVMMDPEDGDYHGLNPVGAELWMLLEKNAMSLKDIVGYLKKTYMLKDEIAMTDAHAFVSAMLSQDFLILSE
ncbi:MAG: PqqD family protein [Legionella sp.]|nr:PqqD family protein [Legionella sp.]